MRIPELYHKLAAEDHDRVARAASYKFLNAINTQYKLGTLDTQLIHDEDILPALPADFDGRELAAVAVLQAFAPIALMDGWWRDIAVSNTLSHTVFATSIAHRDAAVVDNENNKSERWKTGSYSRALRDIGVKFPDPSSPLFVDQLKIPDSAYYLPTYFRVLARNKWRNLPEIVGAVSFALSGELYRLPQCWTELFGEIFPQIIFPFNTKEDPLILGFQERTSLRGEFVEEFGEWIGADHTEQRLDAGFEIARLLQRRVVAAVASGHNELAADPHSAMVELVRQKAPAAARSHGSAVVGGQRLNELFDGDPDIDRILRTVVQADLIDFDDPEASPFLHEISAADGVMFRIFTPIEITIVRRWIKSLSGNKNNSRKNLTRENLTWSEEAEASRRISRGVSLMVEVEENIGEGIREVATAADVRNLFYELITEAEVPSLIESTGLFVEECLKTGCRYEETDGRLRIPPSVYSREGIETWFATKREEQTKSYWESPRERPPLKNLIWECLQWSPYNLTDGSWLQRIRSSGGNSEDDVCRLLGLIHWDEVGNGSPLNHHSNIWRKFLRQFDLEIPGLHTSEFSQWSGFIDEAFVIPVLLMGISERPLRYLPEIAGLTLFVEMGGSGGQSLRHTEDLEFYGLDPTFSRVHNGADNLYGGHALWARDAVIMLMARAEQAGNPSATWDRIRTSMAAMAALRDRLASAIAEGFDETWEPGFVGRGASPV